MADKMLKQAEEPAVEAENVPDPTEEMLEALRTSIADLEEKEKVLTEKLCLAKAKGLEAQADKCRELLQLVILQKNAKNDELRKAEAHKLAAELDELTANMEKEINPSPISEEAVAAQYNYLAKSKRLSVISRAIGFVGVFACMIGAVVYLLLTQVETMNLPFEWLYLAVDGAAAVLFIVIALIVGASANSNKRLAKEIEDDIREQERLLAEQAAEAAMALERLDANAQAFSAETKQDMENAKPAKKTFGPIKVPEISDETKKKLHKLAPVAAACATAVAAVAVVSSQKRAAEERRASATRKAFFKWLG